jgi:RNA polymerase sigma-70 factor (sigma-E family)
MGDATALALAVPFEEAITSVTDGWRGRDEEVTALFATHYPSLCRLAAMLLGDREGAEEAVQEAFLRTFSGWWRIRHPERAAGYLRVAVVNQCRSRARRRVSEDRSNRTIWSAREEGRPEHDPDRSADAVTVTHAVDALPPRQREAVILHYYYDLSEADVARALGCTIGTVKSQLSKARSSLGRALGPDTQEARS